MISWRASTLNSVARSDDLFERTVIAGSGLRARQVAVRTAPPARGRLRQHAWSAGLEPGGDNFLRALHALRVACHGGQELLTGEGPDLQAAQGGDGGCPGNPPQ